MQKIHRHSTAHAQLRIGLILILGLLTSACIVSVHTGDPEVTVPGTDQRSANNAPTVIYLVRHAEKVASDANDPELSTRGRERARALARFFANEPVDVLLSSDYRRTRETLAPLALQKKLTLRTYDASDSEGLVARVMNSFAGKTVVIAGHSNTVPALVDLFMHWEDTATHTPRPVLDEDQYERIYVVILHNKTPATLLELAFSGISDQP